MLKKLAYVSLLLSLFAFSNARAANQCVDAIRGSQEDVIKSLEGLKLVLIKQTYEEYYVQGTDTSETPASDIEETEVCDNGDGTIYTSYNPKILRFTKVAEAMGDVLVNEGLSTSYYFEVSETNVNEVWVRLDLVNEVLDDTSSASLGVPAVDGTAVTFTDEEIVDPSEVGEDGYKGYRTIRYYEIQE